MPADDALAKKLAPDPGQARVVTGGGSVVSVCSDEDFGVLYHRYKLDLWRLASFWLGDRDEAEDVVQETFLRALRALRGAGRRGRRPDAMRAWLLTICRNACTDRLRARRRRDGVVGGSLDAPGAVDVATVAGGDGATLLDVRRALAGMEREEAEAFLLVDVMGLHSDEAARVLGLRAASTLRSRLARARAAIIPVLVEAEGGPGAGGAVVRGAPELWGLLHAPPSQAVVVAFGGGRRRPFARVHARVRDGAELGLWGFFEGLDGAIPAGSSVVAVVEDGDGSCGDGAGRWVAAHPRWELQWAPTHDRWLSEVEALLARCPARGEHEHERMRLLLDEARPFVWTYGR